MAPRPYTPPMTEPRPNDHEDVAEETLKDLAEVVSALLPIKGAARGWLSAPEYEVLRWRQRS